MTKPSQFSSLRDLDDQIDALKMKAEQTKRKIELFKSHLRGYNMIERNRKRFQHRDLFTLLTYLWD